MTHAFQRREAGLLLAPAMLLATLVWAAPGVSAQNTKPATQPQTQTQTPTTSQSKPTPQTTGQPATQTQTQTQTQAQTVSTKAAQASNVLADEPLYRGFKGVQIGTSQDEARKKLGSLQDKSKEMDFFVFSNRERARAYYDDKGKISALIVTYIGKSAGAPTPEAVFGSQAEAKPDGSIYKLVSYPKAGYWVAYSRTAGDEPMTMITMQKIVQ
jgi:hypothetical protein